MDFSTKARFHWKYRNS